MTHTPGPWDTSVDAVPEGYVQISVYGPSGERVATVFRAVENSWLIAAAPDMLAALNAIVEEIGFDPEELTEEGLRRVIGQAYEAIGKATGK